MKMQKIGILIGLTILLLGCVASQKAYETNAALDKMMSQKHFEIRAKFAQPMVTQAMNQVAQSGLMAPGNTGNQIDVSGSSSFLRIQGDTVSANLAYYGERQMGGGYTNDTGIVFKGVPENIEIVKDKVKQNYTIKFSINCKAENFMVNATAGTNLTGTINITSSHRNRIRYTGDVKVVEED